jgi:hypothetical protein
MAGMERHTVSPVIVAANRIAYLSSWAERYNQDTLDGKINLTPRQYVMTIRESPKTRREILEMIRENLASVDGSD